MPPHLCKSSGIWQGCIIYQDDLMPCCTVKWGYQSVRLANNGYTLGYTDNQCFANPSLLHGEATSCWGSLHYSAFTCSWIAENFETKWCQIQIRQCHKEASWMVQSCVKHFRAPNSKCWGDWFNTWSMLEGSKPRLLQTLVRTNSFEWLTHTFLYAMCNTLAQLCLQKRYHLSLPWPSGARGVHRA